MAISTKIFGFLCTCVCLTSALHLEYNALRLDVKERRHVNGPKFQDCPKGFVRNRNACFHVAHNLANWPEANVYCQAYGGHLAFIDSAEESQFVTTYLQNFSASDSATDPAHYYWIGGTDAVSENDWYWANIVRPLQYFNWAPGNPDNHPAGTSKHQDCLAIFGSTGKWDDGWCETKHNFLCEIDLELE